ncbi:MAG: hypothetical protein M0P97_00615 [Candidatus Moranbacteria bacterium]|jgi:hypothetical protein|nr:hypothetical protein [Candidatus Moranbacteria bacterium]
MGNVVSKESEEEKVESILELIDPCFIGSWMCLGGKENVKLYLSDLCSHGVVHPVLAANLAILLAMKDLRLMAQFGAAGWGCKALSKEDLDLWTLRTIEEILKLKIGRPHELPDSKGLMKKILFFFTYVPHQKSDLLKNMTLSSEEVLREFLIKMSEAFFDKDYAKLIRLNSRFKEDQLCFRI